MVLDRKLYLIIFGIFLMVSVGYSQADYPDLKFNEETGHYDFGEIDWDEFWQVVKGHGICNKQRITDKTKSWEEGKWVREAALAYAEKQEEKRKAG